MSFMAYNDIFFSSAQERSFDENLSSFSGENFQCFSQNNHPITPHPYYEKLHKTPFVLSVSPHALEKICFQEEVLHISIVPGGCSGLKTAFQFKPIPKSNIWKKYQNNCSLEKDHEKNHDHKDIISPQDDVGQDLLFFCPQNHEGGPLSGFSANEKLFLSKFSSSWGAMGQNFVEKISSDTPTKELCVWVQASSAPFIHGAHLDYIEEIMSQYFALYHPQAVNQCGCKSSFSL